METIREAQVIDNVDPDKLGKIKVRVFPELLDIPADLLPWATAYQFSGIGTMKDNGTHAIPEKNSYIRVLVEDYPFFKRIRYISDDYVEGLYIYSKFSSVSISELGTQTYPQPFFKCYKDGTIDFHNSSTGEHGTFYKGGGYQFVDASGNIFINAKSKSVKIYNSSGFFELASDGKIKLNGDAKQLVTWTELNTALQTFMTALSLHVHTSAAPGSPTTTPVTPMTLDITTSKTTTVLTSG